MPKFAENIVPREGFIVNIGGVYHLPFDQVQRTFSEALPSGTIVTDADGAARGILAEDVDTDTQVARIMVRGNPTTVNAKALNYNGLDADIANAELAEINIVVVNK